jgi:NADH-quinone oxidoreductase subunit N
VASIGLRVPFSDAWLVQGLFGWGQGWLYSRMVVVDDFAVFFKLIFALAAFATIWMSLGSTEVQDADEGEYYGLVLASTVGLYYMASAANLLMAYLSTVFVALVLLLAGLGFKIASAPFHMWAPDVYEGAPIPVTAFLSVGSKAAGFALLIRFFYPGLSTPGEGGTWTFPAGVDWPALMLVLCMVTMTLGNFAALGQQNVKRMLAYSSIAHAGYTLMGFVVLNDAGLRAMLFYLVTYYLMNLGAFLVVMVVANATGREDLDGYRGLAWRGGAVPAVAMAIFLFSLAGIPPLAGFVGKFYLFAVVVQEKYYLLAMVGFANTLVALYYYMRIIRTMFLDQPRGDEGVVALDTHNAFLLWFLAIPTIGLGLYWAPVIALAERSVRFFLG